MAIKVNSNEIPGTVLEAKRWWRKEIKSRFAQLDDVYRHDAAALIRSKLIHTDAYRNAKTVMLYVSTGREVITSEILTTMLRHGKRVCLPKCIDIDEAGNRIMDTPTMEAREFAPGYKLVTGAYGIAEPGTDAPLVNPEELDLVVLPCVSCDIKGARLGHGAGYYDRYLRQTREDCKAFALCYERVLAEEIPTGPYDVKMDAVITEENIYEER